MQLLLQNVYRVLTFSGHIVYGRWDSRELTANDKLEKRNQERREEGEMTAASVPRKGQRQRYYMYKSAIGMWHGPPVTYLEGRECGPLCLYGCGSGQRRKTSSA